PLPPPCPESRHRCQMSRDMDDKSSRNYFLELLSFLEWFRGSLVGGSAPGRRLIIFGGIQEMFGEDLAGGRVRGGDVFVVDQHQNLFAAMGRADAQVADFAGIADGDFPIGIDSVSAGAVFGFMGRL